MTSTSSIVSAALIASLLGSPALASASCRALSAEEAAAIAAAPLPSTTSEEGWVRPAADLAVGRCGANGAWCVAVGARACETDRFVREVRVEVLGSERLLVMRWSEDHGGNVYYGGVGLQIWTSAPTPALLISVVEQWTEGEVNDEEDPERDVEVCTVRRTVELREGRIVAGRRESRGRCQAVLATERRGRIRLGARGGSWPLRAER